MKELYQSPDMELIEFDTEDIITNSGGGEIGTGGEDVELPD